MRYFYTALIIFALLSDGAMAMDKFNMELYLNYTYGKFDVLPHVQWIWFGITNMG